jgi:hypothetical protein
MVLPSCGLTTRILLSAAFLATTLTPPAVRHLHESDGETAHHRHAANRVAGHEDVHAWAGQVYEHDDATGEHRTLQYAGVEVSAAHPWHLHLVLLGIGMTLPGHVPDDDQREPGGRVLFISVGSGDNFLPSQPCAQSPLDQLVAAQTPASARDASSSEDVRGVSPPERSVLLCDRARHERSGVQLA